MLLVPDLSQGLLLEIIVGSGLVLHLYRNDHQPRPADTLTDYEECRFDGYQARALDANSWRITPGSDAEAVHSEEAFTSASHQLPETVYGYYVTHAGGLLWAERFPKGPYTIANRGDHIVIEPVFALSRKR